MNRRVQKLGLLAVAVVFVAIAGFMQAVLNRERAALGITRIDPLENAPPVLALTTQVLGGFRGLIANALWIRANQMQDDGKYFEMVQLADWITKLEPHFVQVWLVQGWNMAFNISVKFSDYADRWRWVRSGIELLRDDGLRYNPQEPLIYRELAWLFQFKMGQNMDDGHVFYKGVWAAEMMHVFGGDAPNFDRLINPQTPDEQQRTNLLRAKYKMDPAKMRALDERYGPLDWRLPEAHAIYWASVGLENSKADDLIPLRRVIYQSMNLAFQRGKLVLSSNAPPRLYPNLEIIPKVNLAFEQMIADDAEMRDKVKNGYRSFLREVPFQLFINNRIREGEQWLKVLREKYPEAIPPNISLAEFAVSRAMEGVQGQGQVKTTSLLQAFVVQAYVALIEDRPEDVNAYMERARELWNAYTQRTRGDPRIALPPVREVQKLVIQEMLGPESRLPDEAKARLRTALASLPGAVQK